MVPDTRQLRRIRGLAAGATLLLREVDEEQFVAAYQPLAYRGLEVPP